jgi:MFS transporter, MCT family, solute carrier family 16 (monocarboxylic acid transporters), member 14
VDCVRIVEIIAPQKNINGYIFVTATIASVMCTDFLSLVIYTSVWGFTIGAYVGLTSVILVDLLGLEMLTNAFGVLLLFQGIASLLGPPIAG